MALPRVSTERRARPTSNSNPTLCNNLSYVPPSVIAHPSLQDERVSTFPSSARYMPYSRGGKSEVLVQTDEDNPGMKGHTQSQLSKKDYIERYGVTSIRRLDGLDTNDLNSHGQWRELLVDTLEQIGLPYPLYGLKPLIAEAYGFKIIHGQEKHPENRWQYHMSYHFSKNKQKADADPDAPAALFVKLENKLYLATYWWLAGRPVPRQCEGFPEEAYHVNNITTETLAEGT